jgi:hypothetical protein
LSSVFLLELCFEEFDALIHGFELAQNGLIGGAARRRLANVGNGVSGKRMSAEGER